MQGFKILILKKLEKSLRGYNMAELIGIIKDEEQGNIEVYREDDGRITYWKTAWWKPYFDFLMFFACLAVLVIIYKLYHGGF